MEHTYLRYECADSFGLAVSSGSSKAPPSSSNLAFLGRHLAAPLLTTGGSYCVGFNLKSGLPTIRFAHREKLTGGVGSGRALNSDEIVCIDVGVAEQGSSTIKVATGWVDGAVRVFDLYKNELDKQLGVAHSLIEENDDDDFVQREPLVLNGHNRSPVRSVAFDMRNCTRLASGGSDGTVILWDVVAEMGLFRLLGHRGGITGVMFLDLPNYDGLITTSLDGLVKVWDLVGQCCTQTIANHPGEVWCAACMLTSSEDEGEQRRRLITGGNDGIARVWSVHSPLRSREGGNSSTSTNTNDDPATEDPSASASAKTSLDDVCTFMGRLVLPPNVVPTADKIICVRFHSSGRYCGVLHANSKNVEIYLIRSEQESQKKRQRRLRRRQEKLKKKDHALKLNIGPKRGILDDDEPSDDEVVTGAEDGAPDPETLKASDEFEYIATVRASHKVCGFTFAPGKAKTEISRLACALATNATETHSLSWKKDGNSVIVAVEKQLTIDLYGHPTGVRAVSLSSDDKLACTVSKNATKIWNVASRSCLQSLSPSVSSTKNGISACYGLCSAFLPGNAHVLVGTREGHLLIIDISVGDVVSRVENGHTGAVWSLDVHRPSKLDGPVTVVTGSADRTVKFWDIETEDGDTAIISMRTRTPVLVHTRTLEMSDDVIAVRYSHVHDNSKRLVFVATLDCTIKVFYDDSLKLFLSLYGHKLPVLAIDASDDDTILASAGADKTVKIWGLDFGDTHKTLHGHEDSITDVKFVPGTHNFFTSSKDGTVRYWDGDRFDQILLLHGHCAEVSCMAVSRTGAFVLSGGMDRQIRVWERTKDIVFLQEERERELEHIFDKVNDRDEGGTADILDRKRGAELEGDPTSEREGEPQSEAAVKRSILSVSSGDRIMEALERADQELKDIAIHRKSQPSGVNRQPNPLLLNLEPALYVLWVLKSVKVAELEQSLLVLPLSHLERLMYFIILLLRSGRAVELCSRIAIFMVKAHQNQIIANRSLATPLREVRRLIRLRLSEARDMVGYDLAALRLIARTAEERRQSFRPMMNVDQSAAVWAGLGFGSDLAAALTRKTKKR